MSYNTLSYAVGDDGVLLLTLNRPEQLNSFTVEMANELVDAFNRASDDDTVRAVVVTDSGRPLARVGGLQVHEIKGEDGLR